MENKTKKTTSANNRLSKSNAKASGSINKFRLSIIASSVAIGLATARIISYADTFTSMTNKLKIATAETGNLSEVTERMFKIAKETRVGVADTVTLFTRMERATRNLNISQERLFKITGSINKAFAISGATTAEASGAITQLTQAMASGVLRGQEFNSISEQAPIIMEAIKDATGKTAGELRKLAETGAITAEVLIEALERYAEKIDIDFAKSMSTFAQSLETAKTNAIEFVGANDSITNAVDVAGKTIVGLSNNIDALADAAIVAGAILTTRLVVPMVTATATAAALAIATARATIATNLIGGGATKTVFKFNAMGQVIGKVTGTMRGLALSASLARGALTLLGGPVGILLAVVSAFAVYQSSAKDSTESTNKLTTSIKNLNDEASKIARIKEAFKDLTFAELGEVLERSERSLSNFTKRFAVAREKFKEGLISPAQFQFVQAQFDASTEKVEILKKAIEDLQSQPKVELIDLEGKGKQGKQDKKDEDISSAVDKALTQLEEQLAREEELRLESIVTKTEQIREGLLSETEALQEKFDADKEILDQALIDEEERTELLTGIKQKLSDDLLSIKEKEAKRLKAIADKEFRKEKKAEDEKRRQQDQNFNTAMGLNTLLFEDNKAIAAGLIIADTAVAISRQFKDWPFPVAAANAAAIAVGGALQLANALGASKGGGAISGGGFDSAGATASEPEQEADTSTLDITETSEAGINVIRVEFATDSGDEVLDSIANALNERQRQGR